MEDHDVRAAMLGEPFTMSGLRQLRSYLEEEFSSWATTPRECGVTSDDAPHMAGKPGDATVLNVSSAVNAYVSRRPGDVRGPRAASVSLATH